MTNLETLYLNDTVITDLSPIAGLTTLRDFTIIHNFRLVDISPLAGLTNLERLELRDNAIADLTPLAGLENLHWLCLQDNRVTDISPLLGLMNLEHLNISQNLLILNEPTTAAILEVLRQRLATLWYHHTFRCDDCGWWIRDYEVYGVCTLCPNHPYAPEVDLPPTPDLPDVPPTPDVPELPDVPDPALPDDLPPSVDEVVDEPQSALPDSPAFVLGDVTGSGSATVHDAIQILRFIIGLDNVIEGNPVALRASLITNPDAAEPTVHDAIAILRSLVGLPSVLNAQI
jgi:hypothetical protein